MKVCSYGEIRLLVIFLTSNFLMTSLQASNFMVKSGTFSTTTKVLNILSCFKTLTVDTSDKMTTTEEFFNTVSKDCCNKEAFLLCQFASEQLRLVSMCRCYSLMFMTAAMVWYRTSPKLYNNLYSPGFLGLPHRTRIRRVTSVLSVKDGFKVGTMKYLEMRVAKLISREKLVNLAMDEVHNLDVEQLFIFW